MSDRDKYHTATPEDEQRTVRALLNLIPPCEDCGNRQCLPWLREWTRYFATRPDPNTNTPGLPVALVTNLKHDKPRPADVPTITLADRVYRY